MSILYNCHTDGDNYRITKFNDGEVESSYLCSTTECQCPAGSRPICRHRLMLPMFLNRGVVDSFYFLDFDRKGWVSNEPALTGFQEELILMGFHQPELISSERSELGSRQVDEDEIEIIEPSAHMGDGSPHMGGVGARVVGLPQYNDVPYREVESLPATKPSWRRI